MYVTWKKHFYSTIQNTTVNILFSIVYHVRPHYTRRGFSGRWVLCHQMIIKVKIKITRRLNIVVISLLTRACARITVTLLTSWHTHTNTKVVTITFNTGYCGIRTRIPLVSAASHIWYWPMNSFGRETKENYWSAETRQIYW